LWICQKIPPPQEATAIAGKTWAGLHEEYGNQFRVIITEPRDNWEGVAKAPTAMQTLITVFKAMFGNVNKK
jgi:hypothetical protein